MKTFREWLCEKELNETFGVTSKRDKMRNRKAAGLDTKFSTKIETGKDGVEYIKNKHDGGNGTKPNFETILVDSEMPINISPVEYYLTGRGDIYSRDITTDMEEHYKIEIDNKWIVVKDKKSAEKLFKKITGK